MNTLSPLTADRLEAYFAERKLTYTRQDNPGDDNIAIYLLGFPTLTVRLGVFEQALGARGSWAGLVPMESSPLVLAAAQEWNLSQLFPMMTMQQMPGNIAGVEEPVTGFTLRRTLLAGTGLSDEQLHDWLDGTVQSMLECCGWLEFHFPTPLIAGEGTYEDLKNVETA